MCAQVRYRVFGRCGRAPRKQASCSSTDHGGGKRRPFIVGPRHGGQRVVNCQVRISASSMGRVDQIVSDHPVDHEPTAVAVVAALLAQVL